MATIDRGPGSALVKVAVVQAAPVFLDREATVEKASQLIAEASAHGAGLVVFPEAFVPGYPDWVWAVPPGESSLLGDLYAELLASSVEVPGPAVDRLGEAAKAARAHVVVGVSERNVEASGSTLYNTLLYFDADGKLLGKHRKLVPTGGERLVWAQGDGATLEVFDTPFGRLGGLICWENYMPLARYSLYAWGVQVYVAATWDRGEPWLSTLRHIAKEGGVCVLGAGMVLRKADIPERLGLGRFYSAGVNGAGVNGAGDAGADDEWINVGDSAIVGPSGEFLAGPCRMKDEILYAELDLRRLRGPKWMLDVAGHYARPDVFQLSVDRAPRPMIRVRDATASPPSAIPTTATPTSELP